MYKHKKKKKSLYELTTKIISTLFGCHYDQFISTLACYFVYESEIFSDVLDEMIKQQPEFKQIFMAKCMNLSKINKMLINQNIILKKCQKISDAKWQKEIVSSFSVLVKLKILFFYIYRIKNF